MGKKMIVQEAYDKLKSIICEKLATKHGVTSRYIRMVADGDRENEQIFSDFMAAKEKLRDAVEQLVPFN